MFPPKSVIVDVEVLDVLMSFLPSNIFHFLVMNGEKAAYFSPVFSQKRQRTLDALLKGLHTDHGNLREVIPYSNQYFIMFYPIHGQNLD